jgi:hypothetical protein
VLARVHNEDDLRYLLRALRDTFLIRRRLNIATETVIALRQFRE